MAEPPHPPTPGDVARCKVAEFDVEAQLYPHENVVHLDRDGTGRWALTHTITCENLILKGDHFEFVMGPTGMGSIVGESGEVHLLEDLLRYQLYQTPGKDWLVAESKGGASAKVWSLTDRQRHYRSGSMSWGYHVVQEVSFSFCAVWFPRGGFTLFVAIAELYRIIGLSSYKKCPTKLVYNSVPAWRNHLESMGFTGWILYSPVGEAINEVLNTTSHFLPWVAVSSLALLAILVRSANLVPQKGGGGLTTKGQRSLCQGILEGLTRSIAGD